MLVRERKPTESELDKLKIWDYRRDIVEYDIERRRYDTFHNAIRGGDFEVAKRLVSLASTIGISKWISQEYIYK